MNITFHEGIQDIGEIDVSTTIFVLAIPMHSSIFTPI